MIHASILFNGSHGAAAAQIYSRTRASARHFSRLRPGNPNFLRNRRLGLTSGYVVLTRRTAAPRDLSRIWIKISGEPDKNHVISQRPQTRTSSGKDFRTVCMYTSFYMRHVYRAPEHVFSDEDFGFWSASLLFLLRSILDKFSCLLSGNLESRGSLFPWRAPEGVANVCLYYFNFIPDVLTFICDVWWSSAALRSLFWWWRLRPALLTYAFNPGTTGVKCWWIVLTRWKFLLAASIDLFLSTLNRKVHFRKFSWVGL